MRCRPGRHDWEIVTAEQEGRKIRLRRCRRGGCGRWDEMRGVWTVLKSESNGAIISRRRAPAAPTCEAAPWGAPGRTDPSPSKG